MKTVELPDDVVALYAERAARSGRSLVDEVVAKLLEERSGDAHNGTNPPLPGSGRTYRLHDDSIDTLLFGDPVFVDTAPTLAGNGGRAYEVTREEIDAMIFDDVNPEYRPPA